MWRNVADTDASSLQAGFCCYAYSRRGRGAEKVVITNFIHMCMLQATITTFLAR